MQKNSIRIVLTTVLLGVFLVGFSLWAAIKPADAASALRTTPPISSRCGMNSARSKHLPPQGCCASGIITACTGWEIIWPNWNTP